MMAKLSPAAAVRICPDSACHSARQIPEPRSRTLAFVVALAAALLSVPSGDLFAQRPATIGVLDGPSEYTFGSIREVASDAFGYLFVLDVGGFGIRWYDHTGRHRGNIGRTGSGPGELRNPSGLAVDWRNWLHVLDPGNQRISIYRLVDGAARHVVDQHVAVPRPVAICAAGSRRFVLSLSPEALIHELDPEARIVASWGEPVVLNAPGPREAAGQDLAFVLNDGKISCDASSGKLAFASMRTGEVRLYTFEGMLVWRMHVADFHRIRIAVSERHGACCTFSPDSRAGIVHEVGGVALDRDALVVSLRRIEEDVVRYEVRTIDVGAGIEMRRFPLKHIVAGRLPDGRWFGYAQEPFPRVVIAHALQN
jgi:hypothetical protein